MYNIVVDCFGGDNSPNANILGAVNALNSKTGFKVTLCGDEKVIKQHLEGLSYESERVEIVNATQVITCEEQPTDAIKNKVDSSLVKGILTLKNNGDAFVSNGSTGALLVASVLKIGRIKGVSRPALCAVLPTDKNGKVVFLDVGANADCKPVNLIHFAVMGSVYAKEVLKIENPKVALLSNGTEDQKGNELTKLVNAKLKEINAINFVGNVEARDIISGEYDVVVTDGFSGNIALKSMEGIVNVIFGNLKSAVKSNFISKIGGLFLKKSLMGLKKKLDYNKAGGAVFLGANKVIIKAHGSSKQDAFTNAVLQAVQICENNVVETIGQKLQQIDLSSLEQI